MEFRQQALAAEHGGERKLDRLDEAQGVGTEPLPGQFHADERERMLRAVAARGGLGHGGGQLRGIGNGRNGPPIRIRRTARLAGHVGG